MCVCVQEMCTAVCVCVCVYSCVQFIVGKLFCFCFSTPQGLEDVSKYPQLLAALLEDPSWAEEDLKKFAGLNLLRVFRAVEEVGCGSG